MNDKLTLQNLSPIANTSSEIHDKNEFYDILNDTHLFCS